jgi:hypothetical protein
MSDQTLAPATILCESRQEQGLTCDDRGQREVIKEVCELRPHIGAAVLAHHLPGATTSTGCIHSLDTYKMPGQAGASGKCCR